MGKGISASVTAMLCSSFVNYYIDKLLKENRIFSLDELLKAILEYIQPNLLEYEVVSANFLYFNKTKNQLQYAIFSMPPSLYQCRNDKSVHKIKSNNTPLAPYTKNCNIDTLDLEPIEKMLIYSDGLNECSIDDGQKLYSQQLKEDFQKSEDKQTLQEFYNQKVIKPEDDITYIFLNRGRQL
jgi:serine phosphatase RsbU (regulator of sigma subunit)